MKLLVKDLLFNLIFSFRIPPSVYPFVYAYVFIYAYSCVHACGRACLWTCVFVDVPIYGRAYLWTYCGRACMRTFVYADIAALPALFRRVSKSNMLIIRLFLVFSGTRTSIKILYVVYYTKYQYSNFIDSVHL